MGVVILDCETTAGELNEPIEVSFTMWEKSQGKEWSSFQYSMRPTIPILPCATAIHGITNEKVAEFDPIQEALPKAMSPLLLVMGTHIFTGWNVQFDLTVLDGAAQRHMSQVFQPKHVMDLMRLGRKLFKVSEVGDYRMDTIYFHLLPERLQHLLEARLVHSAKVDVELTKELLKAFIGYLEKREGKRPSLQALHKFVNAPMMIEEWPLGKHKGQLVAELIHNEKGYIQWFLKQDWAKSEQPDLWFTVNELRAERRG